MRKKGFLILPVYFATNWNTWFSWSPLCWLRSELAFSANLYSSPWNPSLRWCNFHVISMFLFSKDIFGYNFFFIFLWLQLASCRVKSWSSFCSFVYLCLSYIPMALACFMATFQISYSSQSSQQDFAVPPGSLEVSSLSSRRGLGPFASGKAEYDGDPLVPLGGLRHVYLEGATRPPGPRCVMRMVCRMSTYD